MIKKKKEVGCKLAENDSLAEWLRRWPAKPMGFPRESSNLSAVVFFSLFTRCRAPARSHPEARPAPISSIFLDLGPAAARGTAQWLEREAPARMYNFNIKMATSSWDTEKT